MKHLPLVRLIKSSLRHDGLKDFDRPFKQMLLLSYA